MSNASDKKKLPPEAPPTLPPIGRRALGLDDVNHGTHAGPESNTPGSAGGPASKPPSGSSADAATLVPKAKQSETFPYLLPAVEPDEVGRLNNYRVLKTLGSGGMGMVFYAEDLVLRRPVALKVLTSQWQDADEGWHRLMREARSMAAIKHDNLVTVYQAGQERNVFFIAMELLQGESLADRIVRGPPIEPPEVVRIAKEMARGLGAIHKHGLIHRDIKPSNIWLEGPEAKVKILDFGLARNAKRSGHSTNLTEMGTIVGTPAFMSPEQARGDAMDGRSDLFSLGSVLHCMCTGSNPFRGESIMALLTALAVDEPPPVHTLNTSIPPGLSLLITRLLSKKPEGRPQSAEELIALLDAVDLNAKGPPPSAALRKAVAAASGTPEPAQTSSKKWVLAAVALVLLVVGAVLVLPMFDPRNAEQNNPGTQPNVSPENSGKTLAANANEGPRQPPGGNNERPFPPPDGPDGNFERRPPRPEGQREGPFREGPPRDGPMRNGPMRNGPPREGPQRNGPPRDGPGWEDEGPIQRAEDVVLPPYSENTNEQLFAINLPFVDMSAVWFPQASGKVGKTDRDVPPDAFRIFRVGTRSSPHGIGMHPPRAGNAFLTLKLGKQYKTFNALVTQNANLPRMQDGLVFLVEGDGKPLWESKRVKSQADIDVCKVSVEGVDELKLLIRPMGTPRAAHGIWFEPFLEK